MFVPFMPLVSSRASRNAKTFTVMTDTTVNLTVNHSAFVKSLLENARL